MTELHDRPGPGAVLALSLLGVGVFVLPQLFHRAGFIDFVDGAIRPGGASTGRGIGPVAELSFALDSWLAPGGDLAGVMHLHSALLHVLAALALLFLLARRGLPVHRALAGSVLFLIHPAVLETAAVVAFRPAILAGLLSILAVSAALRRVQGGSSGNLLTGAILVAAAVLSCPLAAVTPVLAAMFGVRRSPGSGAAILVLTAGSVIGLVALPLLGGSLPFTSFAPASVLDPLFALAWPRVGAMVLDPVGGTGAAAAVIGPVALVVLVLIAGRLRRAWPGLAAALGILVLAGVVAGGTPKTSPDFAGYLALVGLGALFANLPLPRRVTIVAAVGAVVLGGALDLTRSACYANGHTLWSGLAQQNPVAARLYAAELAASPLDAQRRLARRHLERAIAALPAGMERLAAQRSLVDVLAKLGDSIGASETAEAMCVLGETIHAPAVCRLALYLRAAQCFSVENSRTKVDEYFAKARELAPTHAEVLAADAEQLYVKLVEAVRRESHNPNVDVAPGWIRAGDPRLVPIAAKLGAAIAKNPNCYRALILEGRIAEATGGVLSAVPWFEQAIAAGPRRAEARILLATLYVANDLPAAAEQCVQKALHDGIDDPAMHYLLGNIYAVEGRRDDARRYLEAYLANRPGNRDARVLLANLLSAEALSNVDRLPVAELKKCAARIRSLNPQDPKGWMVQAAVLCKCKPRRFVEAIVLLEKAARKMPDNPGVKRQLACAHRDYGWTLALQRRDTAMDHFKTFLEIAPRDVATEAVRNAVRAHCRKLESRGRGYLLEGKAAVAQASFGRSAFLSPRRSGAYFQLGLALMNQTKLDAAIEAFETALRLGRAKKEDISHYLLPLLGILQRTGRDAEAKQRALAFLADPGDADPVTVKRIRALFQ